MRKKLSKKHAIKAYDDLAKHIDSKSMEEQGHIILDTLEDNGSVDINIPLNALSDGDVEAASKTRKLNRAIKKINNTASKRNINFALVTTKAKKGIRELWVEGSLPLTHKPRLEELESLTTPIENRQGINPTHLLIKDIRLIAIVTYNTNETKHLISQILGNQIPKTINIAGKVYNDLGIHNDNWVLHFASQQGQSKALISTINVLEDLKPDAFISAGIACGANESSETDDSTKKGQEIGEVLVSKSIEDYELVRIGEDSDGKQQIIPRGDIQSASTILVDRFTRFNHLRKFYGNSLPKITSGHLLSGNKLIDNYNVKASIMELSARKVIGIEMEGSASALACNNYNTPWILVKSICDWGHSKIENKEHNQNLAAKNTAMVIKAMLQDGPVSPSGSWQEIKTLTENISKAPLFNNPVRFNDIPEFNKEDLDRIHHVIPDIRGNNTGLYAGLGNNPNKSSQKEVLNHLESWATTNDKDTPNLFALLGEYGMGKTISCQMLEKRLREKHIQNSAKFPLPLLFDLRHVTNLQNNNVPSLEETVSICIQEGWLNNGPKQNAYTLENIFNYIENGAVIIFDGLDEVLVKLDAASGQRFTNRLLRLERDAAEKFGDKVPIRLLISCRTQYFRTLESQTTHFTGQERIEGKHKKFDALILLPLSSKQIENYLAEKMGDGFDKDRIMNTIRAVHNLEELAERPYTLNLISEVIGDLEADIKAGKPVYGVTLYRKMASQWLRRDASKHRIKEAYKPLLASHLAAYLWKNQYNGLPAIKIEEWFKSWAQNHIDISAIEFATFRDQLEEDLRTATFLKRTDENTDKGIKSTFRFAHTSLQEYFLACYLLQAIEDNKPELWAMNIPSQETLDFLGQLIAENHNDAPLLENLQSWRHEYRAQTSELLFAYSLKAKRNNWPCPILHGINLSGAQLRGWNFFENISAWNDNEQNNSYWLDLSNANFGHADLRETKWAQVKLPHAQFKHCRLNNALFLNCDLQHAHFEDSDLTAFAIRRCNIKNSYFKSNLGYRATFLNNANDNFPQNTRLKASKISTLLQKKPNTRITHYTTHSGSILSCAFSPDQQQLLSAGDDGTLKLWNAHSGELIHDIKTHQGSVWSCAFSPDQQQLLSAGDDGTLKLWNADSGELIHNIKAHQGSILSCAFSPDQQQLLSAGRDGTLKLWNADSGELIHDIKAHQDWGRSCAFSPDQQQLLSAGRDGTLNLWDATTGECLRTHLITRYGHCVYSGKDNQLIEIKGDAWRYMGWQVKDSEGKVDRLPIDVDGYISLT